MDPADAPTTSQCEAHFDVAAAVSAAAVCNAMVAKLIGIGTEKRYRFVGTIAEERTLRDGLTDILQNSNAYWLNSFGKLKIGIRSNATVTQDFGPGNTILGSISLKPLAPAFNTLTATFGDEEYEFASNSVKLEDLDEP